MKRSAWLRLIAVILIISMMAAPVSAATMNGSTGARNSLIGNIIDLIRDFIRDLFDGWFDQPGDDPITPTTPVDPVNPTTPINPEEPDPTEPSVPGETDPSVPGETEPGATEPDATEPEEVPETTLELIEDYSTVENGHLLRGASYSLTELLAEQSKPSNPPFSLRNNGFGATTLGGNTAGSLSLGRTPLNTLAESAAAVEYTKIESITVSEVWAASGGTAGSTWYRTPYFYNYNSVYYPVEINMYGSYYLVSYLNSNGSHPANAPGLGYRGADDKLTCLYVQTAAESTKIEGITGTGSSVDESEAAYDKSVTKAFDGDYNTFWATVPGGNLAECYLIADLGGKYTIDKVQYTKRIYNGSYDCTGNLLTYIIEVSTDGTTWKQVATGNTQNGTTEITFTAVEATHVRLTSTSSYHWQDGTNGKPDNRNTVMTCAEFEVFGIKVTEPEQPTPDPDPEPDPDPTDPVDPDMPDPGMVEAIPFSKLTWEQVKNGKVTYYRNDKCTNPVKVVEKNNGASYELVDSEGDVVATLNGNDLSQKIGVQLYTPSYIVFFPVTMYDYDQDTINNATHALEASANPGLTEWQGIYFNGGSPDPITYGNSRNNWVDGGQYVIQSARAAKNIAESYLSGSVSGGITGVTRENATVWTLQVVSDTTGYLSTVIDGTTYYMAIDSAGASGESLKTSPSLLTITACSDTTDYVDGDGNLLQICGTKYLNQHGGIAVTTYGGENSANDSGNAMWFYKVDGETDNKVTAGSSITAGFAAHNSWAKKSGNNANGDLFYTGLVQPELVNDEIVFTKPDGGIFNSNTDVKDIYEFVGVPFILNSESGVYSFDSDYNGAYFANGPQSGTENAPHNLHFALEAPQPMPHDVSVGDHSTNAFLPFNNTWTPLDNGRGQYGDWIDYHFGMRADLPFSMTSNGRIKETDDNSTPITFTFSGDDDVWIFIDGKLIADLGGIHNRLDITLDFAANTITYSEENGQDDNKNTSSYNDTTFATTQKLFNDTDGDGLLGMTRPEFAANVNHELQFFYLERGKGTSNCHIEFNLPMRDTVLVTKDITKSWSEKQDEDDGDGDGTAPLTSKEQAAVNKLDFYFKLWKKEAGGEFQVVANTNYILQDKDGNFIDMLSTGPDGKFSLKNQQTAKFMTEIPRTGVTYYVEEIDLDHNTFLTPDYNYKGETTYGMNYEGDYLDPTDDDENHTSHVKDFTKDASLIPEHELPMDAEVLKSYDFTAMGSIESRDYLEFICTNYLNAELPNPTARAYEDIIVIDYGLPVQIDPLHNDLFRGEDIEIVAWGDETLTLSEKLDEHGFAIDAETTWTGEKVFLDNTDEAQAFDSGNVTFKDKTYVEYEHKNEKNETYYTYDRDTFEYELTEQLTEVEVIHYIIKVTSTTTSELTGQERTASRYALGKIYIVPATIMYYEENFSDMITFEGAGWDKDFTVSNQDNVSDFQEPGVVGTVGDSTYGSDVAYLSDNGDSNGTYRFGDTTNKAIRFTYTFTGTGTSIFARTSAETGYMQVKIYAIGEDGQETLKSTTYRDTYWKDDNKTDLDASGTLYNIPVFTEEFQDYGTYKVVCTVAKAGTHTAGNDNGSGNEFYLDGIRVMQPLNEDADEILVEKALEAYATDGESNLEVVTLRQKLITDAQINSETGELEWDNDYFVMLTDIDGEIKTAEDYKSIGPKEEVYLSKDPNASNGQKVSFSLKYWEPEGLKLYMGMKAPFGNAKVHVGHDTYELKNAPDCYYDVTNNYESLLKKTEQATDDGGNLLFLDNNDNFIVKIVSNDGTATYYYDDYETLFDDVEQLRPLMMEYYVVTYTFEAAESIVSLTNIKVVGQYEFSIVEDTDINVEGPEGGNDVEPNEP